MFSKLKKSYAGSAVLAAAVLLIANPSFALTKTLPDLVVTNYQDDSMSTLINVVGKQWVKPSADIAAGDNPLFVAKGDFNEDKLQDAVVVNEAGNLIFMMGRGNGVFEPLATPLSLGYFLSDTLAVTDFNNDGHADILVSSQGSSVQVLLGDGHLSGDPAAHFIAKTPVSFANRTNAVAVADFNRDGNMDAVVCDYNNQSAVTLFGNGQGVLTPIQVLPAPTNTQDISTGDFNADGNPDFVVAGGLGDYASVYLGSANGNFNAAAEIKVVTRTNPGLGTVAVAVADMNNDGYDDFVTLGGSSGPSDDRVTVRLWSPAQNNFIAGGEVPAQGAWLAGLNAADMNGDGNNDVVFTSQPSSFVVVVHFGDGQGNLGARNEFSAGNDPNAIAVIEADPILHEFTTRVRFSNKADLVGDLTVFKKKDTLTVTVEDTVLTKNSKPTVALLRLKQGTTVKQEKLAVRPDGSFTASVKLTGFQTGKVTAIVDFIVPVSGTTAVPDIVIHRKADISIVQ